jgi:hypothetical protein
MKTFSVSSDVVTPESAEYSDSENEFFETDLSLRDAVKLVRQTRTNHVGGIDCIEADLFTVRIFNSMEFLTGACETRTLFIPDTVTPASSRRIAKLLGA